MHIDIWYTLRSVIAGEGIQVRVQICSSETAELTVNESFASI